MTTSLRNAPGAAAPVVPGNGASDELQNKFLLVVVARQRARQLQNGARPRVETEGHKFLWVAMQEVIAGTVSWDVGPKPGEVIPV
jgi:DNA-directed RNA polymerase omega subunit